MWNVIWTKTNMTYKEITIIEDGLEFGKKDRNGEMGIFDLLKITFKQKF